MRLLLILAVLAFASSVASAQPLVPQPPMRIDSDGCRVIINEPGGSAAISLAGCTTKTLRLPEMTTAQRNAIVSPAGLILNTTTGNVEVYLGGQWKAVGAVLSVNGLTGEVVLGSEDIEVKTGALSGCTPTTSDKSIYWIALTCNTTITIDPELEVGRSVMFDVTQGASPWTLNIVHDGVTFLVDPRETPGARTSVVCSQLNDFWCWTNVVPDEDLPSTVPREYQVNAFTAQQYFVLATVAGSALVTWNLDTQQSGQLTVAGAYTMGPPNNQRAGGTYSMILRNNASGTGTVVYDAVFKFPSGNDHVLTTSPNAVDIVTCKSDGTNMYCAAARNFQ